MDSSRGSYWPRLNLEDSVWPASCDITSITEAFGTLLDFINPDVLINNDSTSVFGAQGFCRFL